MSSEGLSDADAAALRDSVRSSIERFGDADRALKDIGARDLLEDDGPALSIFFEEFGRFGLTNNLADVLVRDVLGFDLDTGPSFGHPLPHSGSAATSAVIRTDHGVRVDALLRVPDGVPPVHAAVGLPDGGGATVPVAALRCSPIAGFDTTGGWLRIRGEVDEDQITAVAPQQWSRAIAVVRLALGSEILGVASGINAVAIDHVTSRHQFGKALGSFQSVRHRLAESHVAINAALPVLEMGWGQTVTSTDAESDDLAVYAIASKALAGRAFELASRHATQVCGAMGLTWEHRLPALVRRGSALNALLGGPDELAAEIGAALARGDRLPWPDALVGQRGQAVSP